MPGNVIYLHGRPREVAHAVRIGFSDHRRAEHLLSANRLSARRFVVEAANVSRQGTLLRTLNDSSAEIVLDTNVAELSVEGRFTGAASKAPWARGSQMLDRDDMIPGTNRSVIEPIARFAVDNGFTSVMAPAHYLGDERTDWLPVDLRAAEALRCALDREGGERVSVDYPVILTYAQLRDPAFRATIMSGLADLPVDQIWLRVSRFGADASGAGMARYVEAVRDLHVLGRPLMADHLGGLAALAACAFGATSGFAHGIEEKQRFDASHWLRTSQSGGAGRPKRVFLPGLDRSVEVKALRQLFDDVRAARGVFGCSDATCCGTVEKMLANPEAHLMVHATRSASALSVTPESVRTDQFLKDQVEPRMKGAQRALRLNRIEGSLRKVIERSASRLERVNDALLGLRESEGPSDFAPEASLRVRAGDVSRSSHVGSPT